MAIERTFHPTDGKKLSCRPDQERTEYREPGSGLYLRVTRSGARSWLVHYWSSKAKCDRRMKLGNAATMSVKRARTRAYAALAAVADGRDPFAEQQAAREHERESKRQAAEERLRAKQERALRSKTFAEVCRAYLSDRRTVPGGRTRRVARPRTLSIGESILRLYVEPTIGKRYPHTLTSEDFTHVLETSVKRGGVSMPRNVQGFLSAVWRWMETRHRTLGVTLPSESPLVGIAQVGAGRGSRDRVLTPAEIWKLWKATEEAGLAGQAMRFILLTGSRVKEATLLPWSEVDLEAKVWKLPAERSKSARERLIPLCKQALAVLSKADQDSPYAFNRVQLTQPIKQIRAAMGVKDWEPRDLRRTAATVSARLGADPFVVSLLLGHARPDARMPAVTAAYLRHSYVEKVGEALATLGNWVEETVTSKKEPGGVVAFAPAARA